MVRPGNALHACMQHNASQGLVRQARFHGLLARWFCAMYAYSWRLAASWRGETWLDPLLAVNHMAASEGRNSCSLMVVT